MIYWKWRTELCVKKRSPEYGVREWWKEREVRETERERQQMGDWTNVNIFPASLFACHDVIHDDFYLFDSLHCQKAIKWYQLPTASRNKAPRWPLRICLWGSNFSNNLVNPPWLDGVWFPAVILSRIQCLSHIYTDFCSHINLLV